MGNISGNHTTFGFCHDSLNSLNSVKFIWEIPIVLSAAPGFFICVVNVCDEKTVSSVMFVVISMFYGDNLTLNSIRCAL